MENSPPGIQAIPAGTGPGAALWFGIVGSNPELDGIAIAGAALLVATGAGALELAVGAVTTGLWLLAVRG